MNLRELSYSRHFLVVSDGIHFPSKALQAAKIYAEGFQKGLCMLIWNESATAQFQEKWDKFKPTIQAPVIDGCYTGTYDDLVEVAERTETPILFFEVAKHSKINKVMGIFKGLRELRIPFIIYKENLPEPDFSKVAVPVCFVAEDKEKGPYSSNMGRFLHSQIDLIQAKDYGSRARKNIESIAKLYDGFQLNYQIVPGAKDSFKLEKYVAQHAAENGYGMVFISTSRDYGLDDIILGPKEKHIFDVTTAPLLCINPRGDLYVLCW